MFYAMQPLKGRHKKLASYEPIQTVRSSGPWILETENHQLSLSVGPSRLTHIPHLHLLLLRLRRSLIFPGNAPKIRAALKGRHKTPATTNSSTWSSSSEPIRFLRSVDFTFCRPFAALIHTPYSVTNIFRELRALTHVLCYAALKGRHKKLASYEPIQTVRSSGPWILETENHQLSLSVAPFGAHSYSAT